MVTLLLHIRLDLWCPQQSERVVEKTAWKRQRSQDVCVLDAAPAACVRVGASCLFGFVGAGMGGTPAKMFVCAAAAAGCRQQDAKPKKKKRGMKKHLMIMWGIGVAVLVGGLGYIFWQLRKNSGKVNGSVEISRKFPACCREILTGMWC